MVSVALLALLIRGGLLPGPPASPAARADSICVVGHVPGDTAGVDLGLVRRIFLERERFWPDGRPARPVNLPATSALRERFSLAVLGQSVRELAPYWNERYFHGTQPPLTVGSQAAMLLFVERTPGAVGYVAVTGREDLPPRVRGLLCLPDPASRRRP